MYEKTMYDLAMIHRTMFYLKPNFDYSVELTFPFEL